MPNTYTEKVMVASGVPFTPDEEHPYPPNPEEVEFETIPSGGGSSFDPNTLPVSTNTPADANEIITSESGTWYRKAFSKVWDYIKSKIQASSNEVAYGTCSTAAGTATKAVTLDTAGNWVLKKGCRVCVKFTNTNTFSATAESPCKLNVNNTGAKNIYWGNSANPTGTNTTAFGRANYINEYVYDGTYWVWAGSSADNNTTYSAMSTSELTTGTATTSRVVRADYLKSGITSLINSNSYKRFSSGWVYNVKIVSTNSSGQIVWIFTPHGYIALTTAGGGIGIATSWLSNISAWTYTKSGLTITFNTTVHTPMWVVANDNNISVTFTDTSTPQSTTFSNWVPSNATLATYISESDTRNDNQNPQWYMTNRNKRIVTEFKATSIIGVDSVITSGVYCTLLTIVPWNDPSGGLPYQIALSPSGIAAYRVASSKTEWGTWNRVYTTDTTYNDKVKQSLVTDNADYRVLLSNSANDTEETNFVKKNTSLKYNPSTNKLTVDKVQTLPIIPIDPAATPTENGAIWITTT